MGDGVNIAARLQGVAKPGGICISDDVYRQVKSRLDLKVSDLGPVPLKNISEPMRAYSLEVGTPPQAKPATRTRGIWARWPALAAALALVLLAAGAYAWRAGYAPRLPGASVAEDKLKTAPRLSIVVLPFENLGGDPEQQYFADGITDDLTTDLSHVPDSFVIARDTAFTFKGRPVDAKAIGRELGVRYMLEGSVRRAGKKVEINAQLISTETGAHLWADRFEGEKSNLGKLQFEVVARLANSLGVELMKAEVLRDERERPGNPDARDLTMRGFATIWNFNGANKATWNDAIAMFERALALDPHNAHAMTGLALALFVRPYGGWSDDPAADVARAEKTADDAFKPLHCTAVLPELDAFSPMPEAPPARCRGAAGPYASEVPESARRPRASASARRAGRGCDARSLSTSRCIRA
jgi:TolB-like protein